MSGVIGWAKIMEVNRNQKAERVAWRFFWILNTLALLVVSVSYSKRSMVEAMYYLYKQPDFNNFIMEVSHRDTEQWPPQFYSGKWNHAYCIYSGYTMDSLNARVDTLPVSMYPHYVLFFQETDLQKRVENFKLKSKKKLTFVYRAEPSWFDALLHRLNPRNKNEPVDIYRIE